MSEEFIDKNQKYVVTYLLSNGSITTELTLKTQTKVVGKIVETANMTKYFIRTIANKLFDNKQFSDAQLKYEVPERFVETKETPYRLYEKYLNDKTRTSISSIERLI